ncbi:ATP-binding protein [Sulfuricella sp. T08]|uniref:ATP-binding protein n=1 Tax=Sulfuricella sp. T08 TaxID=1632857 RepID=UPI0007511FF8|nr:ATP-binding protein [Sulfuricella sp. T08]
MDEKSIVKRAARQGSSCLEGMAQHIKSAALREDLAFPQNVVTKLRELCTQVKHSDGVSSQGSHPGKGLIVLFTGPCGTGKTKAAQVIANELHLDLYRIDLSTVVSKFIGETEKNLSRLFDAAKAANGILYFDEADGLFGKHTEVKDGHDRYANMEINYLLQRMEDFEGIAILATNSRDTDEAFIRRLSYIVEFPLPKPEERECLWRDVFPVDSESSELPPKNRRPRVL